MFEDQKLVVIPSYEEVLRRLHAVHEDKIMETVYVEVAINSGTRKDALGIALMFYQAILRSSFSQDRIFEMMMYILVPEWIDALVDDQEVAIAAKEQWQEKFGNKRERIIIPPPQVI